MARMTVDSAMDLRRGEPVSTSGFGKLWGIGLLVVLTLGGVVAFRMARTTPVPSRSDAQTASEPKPPQTLTQSDEQQVIAFCSGCHRLPDPQAFPASAWEHEVKRGFQFFAESGRNDLQPPAVEKVVYYFQTRAPQHLTLQTPSYGSQPLGVKFRQSQFRGTQEPERPWKSTISTVQWIISPGQPGRLISSDMRHGEIYQVTWDADGLQARQIAQLAHPAVVRSGDLNGDGQPELIVAELGSFPPEDHELGGVWWLNGGPNEAGLLPALPLWSGIGRVAELQVLDVDQDGDQDLLVGEFGWHKTGGIRWLENQGMGETAPRFISHAIDDRPGTIHLPVADLDGDGRLDFMGLISQEFETIAGFLNRGAGKFEVFQVDEPQDPASGSSGMSLVDLDQDGDLDVLVTYGDTFDSYYMRPTHGIHWLENVGPGKYVRHVIAAMPGAHRALAGDLDGDGDLDLVVAAFLPKKLTQSAQDLNLDSLIVLMQEKPGEFVRYRLEGDRCHHTALEMADFDEDGDLDLAVGNFGEREMDSFPPLTIWWNERISTPAAKQ